MRSPHVIRDTLPALAIALGACLAIPGPVAAQTVFPLDHFSSITVRSGGKVVLRHGPVQRVTVLKGGTQCAGIRVAKDGRLVIDKYRGDCPPYDLEIEVITPSVDEIMVMDGGTIQTRGEFPSQPELGVAVGEGGTIDVRSMTADVVTAAVKSGGRIFTRPQDVLLANVADGGLIRYWGHPRVKSSIEHGGSVQKGTAAEADESLSELDLSVPPVAPIPATPPTRVGTR
jgi:hypothetical protein